MRGDDTQQSTMFSYLSPEKRVPANHRLRPIRVLVDRILVRLNKRLEGYCQLGEFVGGVTAQDNC
jgi:hypothetical protein